MAGKRRQRNEGFTLWDQDFSALTLQRSKKRAAVIFTVFFFCFGVILLRLVDLMVIDHDRMVERASRQYIRQKKLSPQRGVIWDRKMREMASNIESDSLYVVPSKVDDPQDLTRKLAPVLKVSYRKLGRKIEKKRNSHFLWIERKMDISRAQKIEELKSKYGIEALGLIPESRRYYPKERTASHLLGFTNVDNRGIEGLEFMYDEYLRGEARSIEVSTDAKGNRLYGEVREAVSGNNLILTIDERIQDIVERELSAAMKKWKAKAASAIMVNPATGEILAMANRPTYDPNMPGKAKSYMRRNRAVTDIYEPGSTLKSILAAAAIEEGIVDLDEEFDVSDGYIVVGGKRIRDVHKHEILTFQEVIQKSSNVGAVMVGLRLGAEKYYSYLKRFGFGEKTGIDFPGEVRGILRDTSRWSGTSLAALSIGQEIGVTPLQVLMAYAAIANGGLLMRPYIVSDIISSDGEVIRRVEPKVVRRVISESTAAVVRDILKTVVEEGGTATEAYIDGNLVAGKTGTAQIFDVKTGRYSRKRCVGSFVGFVPADDPRLALIVVIYEPKKVSYGGIVAAPVFRRIVEDTFAYLGVPVEKNENHIVLVSR
jgi:cell division protein FtsI (penicillin-binding protein 3)